MTDPFVGEIKLFGGDYVPSGWHLCDGTLLETGAHQALYSLIGDAYGGDGISHFALPDLRGRAPLHEGALKLGQRGGEESVAVTDAEYGAHSHPFHATRTLADKPTPGQNVPAQSGTVALFVEDTPGVEMDAGSVKPVTGHAEPHDNMHPFLAMNYIIALDGIYPTRA
jgi:microcystin-dependent protein